jgi:hypothetical protein
MTFVISIVRLLPVGRLPSFFTYMRVCLSLPAAFAAGHEETGRITGSLYGKF